MSKRAAAEAKSIFRAILRMMRAEQKTIFHFKAEITNRVFYKRGRRKIECAADAALDEIFLLPLSN